jgi:hypothetical protein
MMKTQNHNLGGYNSPIVAMFSLDGLRTPDSNVNRNFNRGNWRFSPLNTLNFTNSGGWSAYDTKRDLFWANGGAGTETMTAFDPKPARDGGRFGTFLNYPRRTAQMHAAAAYDPANDIVVFTVFRTTPDVLAIDLTRPETGAAGDVKLVQTGSVPTLAESHGWEWSPGRRAFIYYNRGSGVFEFKQQGSKWRTDSWKWTGLTAANNITVPAGRNTAGSNGVFSRFQIVTFDDAEIALLVDAINGPVYAFRMPEVDARRVPAPPRSLAAF